MNDIKREIEYNGIKYPIIFNLNVMEQIQSEYGTVGKWGDLIDVDGEPNAKAVIYGFTEMINEGIDIENEETGGDREFLTQKQVGRLITNIGLEAAATQLQSTIVESTQSEEKNA